MIFADPNDWSEGLELDLETRHERDTLNAYLSSSRNGLDWDTSFVYSGEPLVARGRAGSAYKDAVVPASAIATVNDEHVLLFSNKRERHDMGNPDKWLHLPGRLLLEEQLRHHIFAARFERDRFAYISATSASAHAATLVTKPFALSAPILVLNVEVGESPILVKVVAVDASHTAVHEVTAAVPPFSDGLDIPVDFGIPLDELMGSLVRLSFELAADSKLYAFQFRAEFSSAN
jgi:hypothetical protein